MELRSGVTRVGCRDGHIASTKMNIGREPSHHILDCEVMLVPRTVCGLTDLGSTYLEKTLSSGVSAVAP